MHFHLRFHKVAKSENLLFLADIQYLEAVMPAAWPRYITLSGYSIATRHLIKGEWKEGNRTRTVEIQAEGNNKKAGGSQRGEGKIRLSRHTVAENNRKEKDGVHFEMLVVKMRSRGNLGKFLVKEKFSNSNENLLETVHSCISESRVRFWKNLCLL